MSDQLDSKYLWMKCTSSTNSRELPFDNALFTILKKNNSLDKWFIFDQKDESGPYGNVELMSRYFESTVPEIQNNLRILNIKYLEIEGINFYNMLDYIRSYNFNHMKNIRHI